jgi:SAM-dependent methyltransferase
MSEGDFARFEHEGWERAASAYEGSFAAATKLFGGALLDAAGVAKGTRVLDLACGPGWLTALAAARGARAAGGDFSLAMLAEARRAHPGIDFHEADARELPFPDAAFDAVVMSFGLHHVDRPERAAAEVFRVLRPGGAFAFTIWVKPPDNPAWALIAGAVKKHGNPDVPMPAGNDAAVQLDALAEAARSTGFAPVAHETAERTWRLEPGSDLVGIFERGTVRMASMLRGQTPAVLEKIRDEVRNGLAAYGKGGEVRLPVRAFLVRALKPAA